MDGLVCGRIVDSRLFVKFHRYGPAIIFNKTSLRLGVVPHSL